jgi:hypothetical protein
MSSAQDGSTPPAAGCWTIGQPWQQAKCVALPPATSEMKRVHSWVQPWQAGGRGTIVVTMTLGGPVRKRIEHLFG